MSSTTLKHKKDKGKKKAPDPEPKNESVDASWAFQPPSGAKLVHNADIDNGQFDWDAINADEDLELWVLRVPESVKPKHLEGLSLDLPSSSQPKRKGTTMRIGTLKRKHTTYDVWSLGDDGAGSSSTYSTNDGPAVGGEEVKALSCLLPRKSKKGRIYPAPRPIARHIVLSAQPPQPTAPKPVSPSSKSTTTANERHDQRLINPTRQRYPPELLTHRFIPCGSLVHPSSTTQDEDSEDVVMVEVDHNLPVSSSSIDVTGTRKPQSKGKTKVEEAGLESNEKDKKGKEKGREKKSKKRKGEDTGEVAPPKKSKKARVVG